MTDKSPAPRLSVVSVNYGTLDYLRACLRALAASTLQPEFIVVDNDGSTARRGPPCYGSSRGRCTG